MKFLPIVLLIGLAGISFIPSVFAVGTSCVEDGTFCVFSKNPFTAMLQPYTIVVGNWFYVIVWATILVVLWVWGKSSATVSIIGICASSFLATNPLGIPHQAFNMGLVLLALSLTIYVFSIFSKAKFS